jgi:hypothetical protein
LVIGCCRSPSRCSLDRSAFAAGDTNFFNHLNNVDSPQPLLLQRPRTRALSAQTGVNLFGGHTAAGPESTGYWNAAGNRAAAQIGGENLCSQSRAISGG